jgi:hypothetical protein
MTKAMDVNNNDGMGDKRATGQDNCWAGCLLRLVVYVSELPVQPSTRRTGLLWEIQVQRVLCVQNLQGDSNPARFAWIDQFWCRKCACDPHISSRGSRMRAEQVYASRTMKAAGLTMVKIN